METKTDGDILLQIKGVRKIFPGTIALDGIDFELKKSEVHAIVGENGAGKSTLMKIISGAIVKTSGRILFKGQETSFNGVRDSQRLGISMIYQELENIPELTVAENIFLGRLPKARIPGFVDFKKLYHDTDEILKDYDLEIAPNAQLSSLSTAQQQFV